MKGGNSPTIQLNCEYDIVWGVAVMKISYMVFGRGNKMKKKSISKTMTLETKVYLNITIVIINPTNTRKMSVGYIGYGHQY